MSLWENMGTSHGYVMGTYMGTSCILAQDTWTEKGTWTECPHLDIACHLDRNLRTLGHKNRLGQTLHLESGHLAIFRPLGHKVCPKADTCPSRCACPSEPVPQKIRSLRAKSRFLTILPVAVSTHNPYNL